MGGTVPLLDMASRVHVDYDLRERAETAVVIVVRFPNELIWWPGRAVPSDDLKQRQCWDCGWDSLKRFDCLLGFAGQERFERGFDLAC